MCIIAVFKRGKRPDKNTIERMMTTNADGVGIAWNTGKNVAFRKGFTKAREVEHFIERLTKQDGVRDIVFHARIATSGGVSAQKCHPYPMTADERQLNKTSYYGSAPVVFHNGVFSIDIDEGLNDSQTFIKKMLYPLHRADARALREGRFDDIVNMAVKGSRVCLLYPDGVRGFGSWIETAEAWYSNDGYKERAYYGAYRYDEWDVDEDFYADWDEWKKSDTTLAFYPWRRKKYAKKDGAKV